ncbi:MAG: sulfotransferase [Fidelibacterota bacterium]|nr:MAG: sulfotransferase [Candidatus Neomarinimicrobiota bacterium]
MDYAFIIGVARSGTSILGELLESHPRVSYIFEAHGIWELGGMGQNESHRLTEAHAVPDVRAKIQAWFKQQEKPGCFLLEKCPRNTLRVPYLRAIFPEAKIIHIVRDGRDVACSLVPGCGGDKWQHLKPPSWQELFSQYRGAVRCALAWKESVQIALHDLAATSHIQIRYEDLVQTPHEVVGNLLSYLDLEDDPAVHDFSDKIQDTTTGPYQAKIQSMWSRADHRVRIGRYRENLTPEELTVITQMLGPTLEKLGYELEPGPGSGPV